MVAPKPTLSELEERFAQDPEKVELAKVTALLGGYSAEVKRSLDGGVAPAEFKSLSSYRDALEAAAACLPAIWAACRPK